jgi:hypothetical protein
VFVLHSFHLNFAGHMVYLPVIDRSVTLFIVPVTLFIVLVTLFIVLVTVITVLILYYTN